MIVARMGYDAGNGESVLYASSIDPGIAFPASDGPYRSAIMEQYQVY